ncbi:glycosyltransferase family 4 protein [Microbacterium sp.]|uniref:glycosyltransferase family 4 protein n=1 Tax=Microbacterium sp. TaxID=51671 RepID=UPI0025D08D01|nr:glycosyltransferase family 4 protein [Microbacterium sp.]
MGPVEFIVAKDPVTERTGDMAMLNLVMSVAADVVPVRYVALSESTGPRGGDYLVEKPAPAPLGLLSRATRKARSLVHERFDVPQLRTWLEHSDADRFVADHSYMAEAYLATGREEPLYVNTVVSESLVWRATHGMIGRAQAPFIRRDELRVAQAATAVGTYDAAEAAWYRSAGVGRATWLDVTLPPLVPRPVRDLSAPRVVFLGDRRWPPNDEGARLLLDWWPEIAAGIPDAELLIVGRSNGILPLPEGVEDLDFVDDLDGLLSTARGILAPIRTGGGVRVKVLEAAARGLPVVGTEAAIGSLADVFGLPILDTKDEFVAEARRLLADPHHAAAAGDDLYERNEAHWAHGGPQSSVEGWLK